MGKMSTFTKGIMIILVIGIITVCVLVATGKINISGSSNKFKCQCTYKNKSTGDVKEEGTNDENITLKKCQDTCTYNKPSNYTLTECDFDNKCCPSVKDLPCN